MVVLQVEVVNLGLSGCVAAVLTHIHLDMNKIIVWRFRLHLNKQNQVNILRLNYILQKKELGFSSAF